MGKIKSGVQWVGKFLSNMRRDLRLVFREKDDSFIVRLNEKANVTAHLKEYLRYYISLQNPGYALLVTGPWGIGKTWQVLQCIPEDQRYYVSLHGAKSSEDVQASLIAALVPSLSSLNESFSDLGKDKAVVGSTASWIRKSLLNKIDNRRIIILDDIERSSLPLDELTGFISSYLDEKYFRVILVADEEKIIEKEKDYKKHKEKIVGQTLKVDPQIDSSFDYFVSLLNSKKSQDFVARFKGVISSSLFNSGGYSLRVLRQIIQDVARLQSAIGPKYLENGAAIEELIGMFTALNAEARLGNISPADVVNRRHAKMRYSLRSEKDKDQPAPPFVQAVSRHDGCNLESDLLSDEVLLQVLFEGRYNYNKIQESLDNSLAFKKHEEAPPWKIVINFDEVDQKEVDLALSRMDEQFEKRLVTDSGEMLQIFSLRMMLVKNEVREGDLKDVLRDCIAYVDDLLEENRLPPREINWDWTSDFNRAHGGYVYWTHGFEDEFKTVLEHLISSREMALQKTYPDVARELLELAKKDGLAFFEQVGNVSGESGKYAHLPVLTGIEPEQFCEVLLNAEGENARNIWRALQSRYDGGRLSRELSDESEWAMTILECLDDAVRNDSGFNKLRLRRLIPKALRDHKAYLNEVAGAKSDSC
ncbi:P-loop NTPase fold protein [Thalassospira tepidiphila]|uniref:P-loop NTPase fold protein n=1 Tax=Thalassospira tepidiphila TaxID=393657 RepID=UPI003AA8267A